MKNLLLPLPCRGRRSRDPGPVERRGLQGLHRVPLRRLMLRGRSAALT